MLARTGLTAHTKQFFIGYLLGTANDYVPPKDGTTWLRESATPEELSGQLCTGLSCPNNEDGRGKQQPHASKTNLGDTIPSKNQKACMNANTTGMDFVWDARQAQ